MSSNAIGVPAPNQANATLPPIHPTLATTCVLSFHATKQGTKSGR